MQIASKKVEAAAITYPHCKDTEEVVLGCMLLDREAVSKAMALVSEIDFYTEIGKGVFIAIAHLITKREGISLLSVTGACRDLGILNQIGGVFAITNLTTRIGSTVLVEQDCLRLKQFTIKRMCIDAGLVVLSAAQDDTADSLDTLDALSKAVKGIYNNLPTAQITTKRIAEQVLDEYNQIDEGLMVRKVIKTYIDGIDKVIGGMPESGVIMILAPPSVGKTTKALQMCVGMAKDGIKSSFISLETGAKTVTRMVVSNVSDDLGVTNMRIYLNKIKHPESKAAFVKASASEILNNILIEESFGSEILKIKSAIYGAVNNGAEIVFIDYLQLITTTKNFATDNAKLEYIIQILQDVSQDLLIPIVVLSQLTRPADKTVDYRFVMPKMTDGRSSGMIEQAAVLMFGICLEEKSTKRMADSNGTVHYRFMKISVLKNKAGSPTFDQHIPIVQVPSLYKMLTPTDEYEQDYLSCCGGDVSNDLTNQLLKQYGIRNPYTPHQQENDTSGFSPIADILAKAKDPYTDDEEVIPF